MFQCFGRYVAPEYASSGFLNEKSDVYSFGVLLLESITGRDPVDDSRPVHEKNLVDWLKMMVAAKRADQVLDPNLETRPSTSALKRALLTALRCVDPNAQQRPTMSQVVRMLESDEYPILREVCALLFEIFVSFFGMLMVSAPTGSYEEKGQELKTE